MFPEKGNTFVELAVDAAQEKPSEVNPVLGVN